MRDGTIIGAEALIRWRIGERMISPAVFIPLAEETGLISAVGRWVFEETCHRLREWHQTFNLPPNFRVAVNISVQQLEGGNLDNELGRIMQESGVETSWLELEITETLLMEGRRENIDQLARIRQRGCGVALDDFGTGYSSLGYLAQLPLTVLKIDKTFVDDIHGPRGSAIVSAVLALAKGLEVEVVAEGVETEDQARELQALGCHFAQGYFYSKPLSVGDIEALFSDRFGRKDS